LLLPLQPCRSLAPHCPQARYTSPRQSGPSAGRLQGFLSTVLQSLRPRRPTHDHAAKPIPPISENEDHMGDDKKDEYPRQPEVPDARVVITTDHPSKPRELHGLVNRPARDDG